MRSRAQSNIPLDMIEPQVSTSRRIDGDGDEGGFRVDGKVVATTAEATTAVVAEEASLSPAETKA